MKALLEQLLPFLVPLILPALGWLFAQLGGLAKAKAAGTVAGTVLDGSFEVVRAVVAHVDAVLKPEIAKSLADGKISPEEAKALKDAAMKAVLETLGAEGLKKLRAALNIGGDKLEVVISGWIERAVSAQKAAPAPAPANP